MTLIKCYLAHPVVGDATGLNEEQIAQRVIENRARALRWLRWIITNTSDVAIRCSWIGYIGALPETLHMRARGLRDNGDEAASCDGIILCGGYLSSGMRGEVKRLLEAPPINPRLAKLALRLDHEKGRYTGDGAPDCVGSCMRCALEEPNPRFVLDLLDFGAEPPSFDTDGIAIASRLSRALRTGTNGPTTSMTWL